MPRLLAQIAIPPFFGILTITPLLQSSSILSLVHTVIHIRNSHSINLSPPAFSISPVTLLYPAALLFLRFLTARSTSFLAGGLKSISRSSNSAVMSSRGLIGGSIFRSSLKYYASLSSFFSLQSITLPSLSLTTDVFRVFFPVKV